MADTEAEEVLLAIADDAGWTPATQLKLLCRFIEESDLTGEMEVFLEGVLEEEDAEPGEREDD